MIRSIQTRRLSLEPQTVAHADEMFALLQDPQLYRYENAPPDSLDGLRERFRRLESRRSADGRELWLNWVVRLADSRLIGFVQATVHPDASAGIAYVMASAHWGQGFGREAVAALIGELAEHFRISVVRAVLKRDNLRSVDLLTDAGFVLAGPADHRRHDVPDDEIMMVRDTRGTKP